MATTKFSTGLFRGLTTVDCLKVLMQNGVIVLFSGAQPAKADDVATGTVIGYITVDGGAFVAGTATNGLNLDTDIVLEDSAYRYRKDQTEVWKFVAASSGTIGYYRYRANPVDSNASSTTLYRIDGSVGLTNSTADLWLPALTVTAGQEMTIDRFRFRVA